MVSYFIDHYAICTIRPYKISLRICFVLVPKRRDQFQKEVFKKRATYHCYKIDAFSLDISNIDLE